jgi:hypothetical protein
MMQKIETLFVDLADKKGVRTTQRLVDSALRIH